MANSQTRQLRKMSRQAGVHKVTYYIRTDYKAFGNITNNPKAKKHRVEIIEFEHGKKAFDPSRAKLKNRQRGRQAFKPVESNNFI